MEYLEGKEQQAFQIDQPFLQLLARQIQERLSASATQGQGESKVLCSQLCKLATLKTLDLISFFYSSA